MTESKQDLGLAVLTSSAVFGAWSAWNSSLFTAATFVDNEEKYRNAKLAMDLGLITSVAAGAGVYGVYGEKGKVAAASAVVTGVLLYTAYYFKLLSNPKVNGYMMGNGKGKADMSSWKPLTDNEINEIKNTIDNSSSIRIVSEP